MSPAAGAKEGRRPDIVALRPGLWLVETRAEAFDVRAAVVAGTARCVVWDTLSRPPDMEGVAELTGDLPLWVAYSHGDWDHVWGTGGLSRAWEEIVAHEACGSRFRDEIPATLTEKVASEPDLYGSVVLVPPTRTFRRRITLELGGITLELHSLPGHTPDTIVGYIPQWNILLGGDAVEHPLPFLNPGSGIEGWVRRLERWAARLEAAGKGAAEGNASGEEPGLVPPLPVVIPSHGPIGGPRLLRANARYLRELAAGTEPELPSGLTPFYRETHAANLALARD
jgi:glyoxylase-like metal-dependent hydrolase (beta-lactamase superfamily II)